METPSYCSPVAEVSACESEVSSPTSFEDLPSAFLFLQLPLDDRLSCLQKANSSLGVVAQETSPDLPRTIKFKHIEKATIAKLM